MTLIVYSNEEAARSAIDHAKLLAGQTNGGCIDNWHHLFDVFAQQTEK